MGQALKRPLRIPALDHGIAESVDDLVVGTDDSRIAAKTPRSVLAPSMPNSPLSQACTASLGASFRRDAKRCRSRMFWKYAHCRLQVQGAQRRQQHLPSAFAAVGYMPRWLGRFWIVSTRDEKNRGLTGGLKTWPESA